MPFLYELLIKWRSVGNTDFISLEELRNHFIKKQEELEEQHKEELEKFGISYFETKEINFEGQSI